MALRGLFCSVTLHRIMFVPFDTISDCEMEESRSNGCIYAQNALTCIILNHASNASSEGKGAVNALLNFGLKEPEKIKELVSAMKISSKKSISTLIEGNQASTGHPFAADEKLPDEEIVDKVKDMSQCSSCYAPDGFLEQLLSCQLTLLPLLLRLLDRTFI